MNLPSTRAALFRTRLTIVLAGLVLALSMSATTVIPPSFEELVGESDYIVHGRVTSVESRWEQRGKSRVIVTKVELDVIEVVAGTPPDPLVLTMLGGTVDGQTMALEGAPRFQVGDTDILFVRGNGRLVSPLTRIMHGRYRIERDVEGDREFVTRGNGEPLTATSEVSRSLHTPPATASSEAWRELQVSRALTPAEFVRQIRLTKLNTTPIKHEE